MLLTWHTFTLSCFSVQLQVAVQPKPSLCAAAALSALSSAAALWVLDATALKKRM
jgi:hypothetical protein